MKRPVELKLAGRSWSKMPAWWVEQMAIADHIPGGERRAGTSIALIRLLLWLPTITPRHDAYAVEWSIDALAVALAISKPMVRRAIAAAVELGYIRFHRGGGRSKSRFDLVFPIHEAGGKGGFTVIPHGPVQERLWKLPTKGEVSLAAHKIYLALLAGRDNGTRDVVLHYDTLQRKTSVQPHHIRSALSVLALEGFLQIDRETLLGSIHASNVYKLRGDFGRYVGSEGATAQDVNNTRLDETSSLNDWTSLIARE